MGCFHMVSELELLPANHSVLVYYPLPKLREINFLYVCAFTTCSKSRRHKDFHGRSGTETWKVLTFRKKQMVPKSLQKKMYE